MGKAQALWNAQNHSTNHADIIKAELKKRLVVPSATRWNSTYNAVSMLTSFFTTHRCDILYFIFSINLHYFVFIILLQNNYLT